MVYLIFSPELKIAKAYAESLVAEKGCMMISLDDWIEKLFAHSESGPSRDEVMRCEEILWDLCIQLDMYGNDVVACLGKRSVFRDKYEDLAQKVGVEINPLFVRNNHEINDLQIFDLKKDKTLLPN